MLEKQVIQSVGFHNITDGEKIWGFQLRVRLPYYRGVYLSQIRPGTLKVDDMVFEKAGVIWNIDGKDYTWEEMAVDWHTHWAIQKPAVLKVKLDGGLCQGYHDISYGFCYTSSYMPPVIQNDLDPNRESFIFMPEFGKHVNTRRLLIV